MDNYYLVSIIIPVYNVEEYLRKCLDSIINQTYQNLDIILVDDGSKDASGLICDEYASKDTRIKVIHKKNGGLSSARNAGLDIAKGFFVMHVDSDDYVEYNAVELLANKQKETDADIVSGNALKETRDGQELLREPDYKNKEEMLLQCIKPTLDHVIWRRLIRLSLYRDNHIHAREGVNVGEDWQVMPQLIYYANKIAKIDDVIYHYNCMNEGSYMSQKRNRFNRSIVSQDIRSLEIVEDFFKDKDEKYKEEILKYKGAFFEQFLTPSFECKDIDFYNLLAKKILGINKNYLKSIGWNKLKVRIVNGRYLNRWFYESIHSLIQ